MPAPDITIDRARLAAIRGAKYLTLRELAQASGVSARTLEEIESGERQHVREATLFAVAKALGVRPDELRAAGEGEAPAAAKDEGDGKEKATA